MAETIQELLVDPRCQDHISATVLCEKMFSAVLIRRILARIAGLRYCMIFQGRMSGASVSPPKRWMPFAFAMVLRCELSRARECVRLRVFRKFGRRVLPSHCRLSMTEERIIGSSSADLFASAFDTDTDL